MPTLPIEEGADISETVRPPLGKATLRAQDDGVNYEADERATATKGSAPVSQTYTLDPGHDDRHHDGASITDPAQVEMQQENTARTQASLAEQARRAEANMVTKSEGYAAFAAQRDALKSAGKRHR